MNIKNKVSDALKISDEIILNIPLFYLVGKNEVSIENYKGIVLYSENKIKVNTHIGIICINGNKLSLSRVLAEKITITGDIIDIGYN